MKLNFKATEIIGLLIIVAFPIGMTPIQAQGKIDMRMAWWGSQIRHDATIKVIQMFEQLHPNINITWEFLGFNDYWLKMTTEAAGNNLPDIMQQDYAYITEWQSRNLIIPLDSYVADGTLNFKDVADSALNGGKIDGKLYADNLGMNSQDMVLDADCFTKAGIALPKPDWTWDDFEQTAMALTAKLGIPGMGTGLDSPQNWKNVYLSLGQWAFSVDGTALGYTDDKPFVDFLSMILRLQAAKAIFTREQENANNYQLETDPITKGQSCMASYYSNQIVALYKAAGANRNLLMAPIPRVKGATQSANYLKPSQFWSITPSSQHPKEAAMFIDFFTNSIDANKVLAAERGVPISSVVRDGIKAGLDKATVLSFDYIASLEKTAAPVPPPDPAGYNDILTNVYYPEVLDAVLYGQISPVDGAARLRTQATDILAKNKK